MHQRYGLKLLQIHASNPSQASARCWSECPVWVGYGRPRWAAVGRERTVDTVA